VKLYRVLDEALNNVRMHSGAHTVEVRLGFREGDLAIVSVTDDGIGAPQRIGERTGLGMLGIRERAVLWGASPGSSRRDRRGRR
jgi:signal transduction histidine kinase